jgi:hypothetical protein
MITCVAEDNLLVASTNGYVSYSTDGNSSWTNITSAIESTPTPGATQVTADPDMTYIYACSDAYDGNVMRWKVGQVPPWEDIYVGTMGAAEKAYGIALVDGVLYIVTNDDTGAAEVSTLRRNLSPTLPKTPASVSWSSVASTASPSTLTTPEFIRAPQALKVSAGSTKLWAIDVTTTADLLCSIVDPITAAGPELTAPTDLSTVALNPITGHAYDVAYNWSEPADNVTQYDLWIAFDEDFDEIVRKEESIKATASTVVFVLGPYTAISSAATVGGTGNILEYMPGMTYYWKVRVDAPLTSPWSEVRSFTVGAAEVEEVFAPEILAPAAGATNVNLRPTFMWTEVEGAVTYELEVSLNSEFRGETKGSAPLVQRAGIASNVYILETDLDYGTAYYWRVRATTTAAVAPKVVGDLGPWVTGVFTTMPEPEAPPEPEEPTPPVEVVEQTITPGWIYAIIGIGAVLVIAVLVLIVRTRRVV